MTPEETFVAYARGLVSKGVRWRHRGRKPWAVDCIGLLVLSGEAAGLELDDSALYGREPWDDQLRTALVAHFGEPVTDWKAADVPLIRWRNGEPSHVGILADHPDGGLSIIHVHNLHGVIEQAIDGPILKCIVEVYRPWPKQS